MELSLPDMPSGVKGDARLQPRTQASLAVTPTATGAADDSAARRCSCASGSEGAIAFAT